MSRTVRRDYVVPADWILVQDESESRRSGNELYRVEEPGPAALLKIYRRRGSRWSELLKRVSQRFEGRRGVTARERCALERETLALWRASGFDVPAVIDRPVPGDMDPRTTAWLEYCPGRLLSDLLQDAGVTFADKVTLVERLAAVTGRRHALAFERHDTRLLVEHASVKHVLVSGDRLVHFDFETAFTARADLVDALSREVSTLLRSIHRHALEGGALLATHFVRAHTRHDLLRRAAEHGAFSRDPRQRLRRWLDRRGREAGIAKADMLAWLAGAAAERGPEAAPR